MTTHEDREYWDHTGLAKLIAGFLLAPFAWLLDLQVSYATVKWACAANQRAVLFLLPLGSLALIGFATWTFLVVLDAAPRRGRARRSTPAGSQFLPRSRGPRHERGLWTAHRHELRATCFPEPVPIGPAARPAGS